MVKIRLLGTPFCHRYQQMREVAQNAADELGLDIQIEEITDTGMLAQSNPLDLPKMVVGDVVIASRNPPKKHVVQRQLRQVYKE